MPDAAATAAHRLAATRTQLAVTLASYATLYPMLTARAAYANCSLLSSFPNKASKHSYPFVVRLGKRLQSKPLIEGYRVAWLGRNSASGKRMRRCSVEE